MTDLLTRRYGNFRGLELRPDQFDLSRSPDGCNLWRDYRAPSALTTRPGLALHTPTQGPVWGIFFYGEQVLIHEGSRLWAVEGGASTLLRQGLAQAPSQGFLLGKTWYFKDGANYLAYDGSELQEVAGYVPTTSIARGPLGGGVRHEDVNMLTPLRRNSFLADGASFDFHLDARDIDAHFVPRVWLDGQQTTDFTVDYAAGVIRFSQAPGRPLTDGQDNLIVEFSKTIPGYRESILGCTLLQPFDNRVFFSGNPEYPNLLWHCALSDPSYVSDLDFYREGLDDAPIRGLAGGNNALWVFRAPSEAGTSVFYHMPILDETYGKIYPACHSSLSLGCTGAATNFADDIVFFSPRGMEGIAGDVTTGQFARHRSSCVDRLLTANPGYSRMRLAQWEGYLVVAMGQDLFLADSRSRFGEGEYDWFRWELEAPATALAEHQGVLWVGTGEGVYTLTDTQAPVRCWWTTPLDPMGNPHRRKSAHRRGCTAECAGDVTLLARKNGEEFGEVAAFSGVTDAISPRLRVKKFKDIQLRFASDTRFSLQSVTLQAWLEDYIC